MSPLFCAGDSIIHRAPAGLKLSLLCSAGIGLFYIDDYRIMLGLLAGSLLLYRLARLPLPMLVQQLRALSWLIGLLMAVQWWSQGWAVAIAVSGRLLLLLLLANLVTLTTRISAIIDVLNRLLAGFRYLGLRPERISLALALALRFLPIIIEITQDVRAAQKARGLEFSLLATAVPVIIRTLKMADEIADAIESRQG